MNVRDVDRSIAWYREVLGFDEPWFAHNGKVVLFHPESRVELVFQQRKLPRDELGEPALDHVAFLVESVAELRAWQSRLGGLGLDLQITPAVGGVSINLEDPDGNDLELFVYDPPRN